MTQDHENTDYQVAIKKIIHLKEENKPLYYATCYAISLIICYRMSLDYSIKKAKRARSYPVAAHIDRAVRTAIPKDLFLQRQKNYREKHFPIKIQKSCGAKNEAHHRKNI